MSATEFFMRLVEAAKQKVDDRAEGRILASLEAPGQREKSTL
jgi:hypothetical protein